MIRPDNTPLTILVVKGNGAVSRFEAGSESHELLIMLREGDTMLLAPGPQPRPLHSVVLLIAPAQHPLKALGFGINTTTPAGKFLLTLFASLVEYDRQSS